MTFAVLDTLPESGCVCGYPKNLTAPADSMEIVRFGQRTCISFHSVWPLRQSEPLHGAIADNGMVERTIDGEAQPGRLSRRCSRLEPNQLCSNRNILPLPNALGSIPVHSKAALQGGASAFLQLALTAYRTQSPDSFGWMNNGGEPA